MVILVANRRLELHEGDITDQSVDAIVNAANSHLAGGGGVDGAIHRRGGPEIIDETSRRYPDGCPTGSAVITGAGKLAAKYVIHAVGPRWSGGARGEAQLLKSAYKRALTLAIEHQFRSIALPSLSTGAYGFPVAPASQIALSTAIETLRLEPNSLEIVLFVLFGTAAYETFAATLSKLTAANNA
jgi:O-acetyl-ADP-ribose deacetylase